MRAVVVVAALASLGLASLGLASLAQAQSNMQGMSGMSAPATKHGQGTGVIKALDPKAGSITLQHGPIPAVSWPAMTMTFKAKPALLKGLKVGQTIGFDADVDGMAATVTAVRKP
jgi:Cu(I)/Ag(I) efflux system protein CusF